MYLHYSSLINLQRKSDTTYRLFSDTTAPIKPTAECYEYYNKAITINKAKEKNPSGTDPDGNEPRFLIKRSLERILLQA